MNKKKINKILIIAVTIIWGVLLYKYINPFFSNTQKALPKEFAQIPHKAKKQKETITLNFPKRDPFLGKLLYSKKQPQTVKKHKPKLSKNASKKNILWPKIEYLGFVKSSKSKSPLGLLRIDGILHRVNEKTIVRGLKIKTIEHNKIIITNNSKEKSFTRK